MHQLRIVVLVFAAFFILNVQAQPYPNKPVRIVVPFAPGGATDVIARIISVRLTDRLKQRVIVDNRPGGAAILGSDLVAKSPADGYTLLFTANPHTVNLGLQPKLPYHPMDDFEPITLAGLQPLFLTLHPSISAQTLPELIAELKAHPDKYSYSTSGTGGPQHLAGEMFKSLTGTRIMHIPFKGAAPATTELLSGRVQIGFAGSTNVLQFIPSGKLKILATSSATRTRFAPQVPTLQELGLTAFESVAWLGLLAPKGVPADIIQLLADEVRAILNEEKTKEALNLQGIEGVGNTPKEFTAFLRADLQRTNKIIKENNITPD
jgi:hypothetical protein